MDRLQLKEAMKGLKLPTHIVDAPARITTFCFDFFDRLDSAVPGEFKLDNPGQTIRMVVERIRPLVLNTAMEERLLVEPVLKDNVRHFLQHLKAGARACQAFGQSAGNIDRHVLHINAAGAPRNNKGNPKRHTTSDGRTSDGNKYSAAAVECLYPPHREKGIKHKLNGC